MKKEIRKGWILTVLMAACAFFAGCGSAEQDESARQVMKIVITPVPTPTPAPKKINPDAVAENGGITMVNQYVMEKSSGNSDASAGSEASGENTGDILEMTEPSEGGES